MIEIVVSLFVRSDNLAVRMIIKSNAIPTTCISLVTVIFSTGDRYNARRANMRYLQQP